MADRSTSDPSQSSHTTASSTVQGSDADEEAEHVSDIDVGSTRAFHHNGNVLFESSQMTGIAAVGIRTAHFPRPPCTPWCSCVCHKEAKLRSPKLLERLIGSLFIGYSGLPVLTKECNEASCHLRAQPSSSVTYFFPRWFLARAVAVVMTTTPLAGPVVDLKFQRIVPGDADIFRYAMLGDIDKLENLFINGLASPNDVHAESGVTALHLAVSHRKIEACKYLLKRNADAFLEDKVRWTAADNAWEKILARSLPPETERALRLMFSETECIERREFTLLHKIVLGLVPNDLEQHLQGSTADIDARDTNNRTPISLAADRGDLSAVTTLLRYNADPRIGSSCFATPLHFACCARDPSCIQPLIDAGAQVDALTDWEQTPLIYAAAYTKDARHANTLLDAGADKNWRDRDGIAPLAWATIADNTPVAMALLARDVDIDSASLTGETALSRCVASNRLRILRELVSRGASPELHMASRESLLHIAAKNGSLETLRILQGLDLHHIDRWQKCI